MSEHFVAIIPYKKTWAYAELTNSPSGWKLENFRGFFKRKSCLIRARSSAMNRKLPLKEETEFTEEQLNIFIELIKQKNTSLSTNNKAKQKQSFDNYASLALDSHGVEIIPTATVYFDGSSHGTHSNPGISGAAAIIELPTGETFTFAEFIPSANASEAEYMAAILGLQSALNLGHKSIQLRGDSREALNYLYKLLQSQILPIPKKKSSWLSPLHEKALPLLNQFDSIQILWIPRAENNLADSAVRKVVQDNQPKTVGAGLSEVGAMKSTRALSKPAPTTSKAAKTPKQPKEPSTCNPPENKNKKKETIKLNAAIEKLYNLSLPTMPPVPHLAEQIEGTIPMGKKARVSDYETLKSGWDEYSSKRLPTLMALVPDLIISALADILPHVKPKITEADKAKIYRWILRGLPAFMAVRKIEVDAKTQRKVVKALRRSGRI